MYIIFDELNNIVGCHDELMVTEEYQSSLKYHHGINTRIKYMKDKKAVKKFGDSIYEFELTAYKESYIPYKYIDYVEYAAHDMRNIQYCKDVLISLYDDKSLSKRECKNIKKVIFLLDDIMADANSYTPSPKELNNLKMQYDELIDSYRYNVHSDN